MEIFRSHLFGRRVAVPCLLAMMAFLSVAAPVRAASYDCAKAGTRTEHMICGDAGLSTLDERLGNRYMRARGKAADPNALRGEQRAWLRNVRNACTNAACLKAVYNARVAELTKIGWMTEEKARAICERVAAANIDGSYHNSFREVDPDEEIVIDSAPGLQGYRIGHPLNVDYDGDGEVEKLNSMGQYGGTCQSYSVSLIVDITKGEPEINPAFDLEWQAGHQQFLIVDGEPVFARTPNDPKSVLHLDWLTPAGGVMPLCSIAIKRERRLETAKSENPALCRAVAENTVEFLSWSLASEEINRKSAAAEPGRATISSMSLDIDVDGDDDTIAWVNYSSSAGCGYEHHWLVEMSDDLISVAESPLNSVLIDKGPHIGAAGRWREWAPSAGSPHTGWDSPRIFIFDGKPYILGRAGYGSDSAAVISVWGGEERTWCEYEYPARPKNSNIRHYPIQPPSGE